MSRCFPYPPPGYTMRRGSNEALIESIKIQKEKEKAKGVKRTEKDEKKKLKKEKAKPKAAEFDLCGGKKFENSKGSILHKKRKDVTEQLERSSITEEHELAQNASCSSDSTHNSNKRRRHADGTHAQAALPASDGAHVQDASAHSRGNIVRIRLPSQKNMKCEINKEQQLSSPSIRSVGRPDKIASRAEQNVTCSSSAATPSTTTEAFPPIPPNNPPRPLNNGLKQSQIPSASREDTPTSSGNHHVSKESRKRQKLLHKYTKVLENFLPPFQPFQSFDTNDDDEDWFLGLKKEHKPMQLDKTSTVGSQIPCYSSCSMWPSARHLPDTDVYALPYTIPF